MPTLDTIHFGQLDYREETLLEFPQGLPAFEHEHWFIPVEQTASSPILFLQSMVTRNLVFLTIPVEHVAPDYRLSLSEDESALIGLGTDVPPVSGREVAALAVVAVQEDGTVTANLMAPVVINRATRKACQAIQPSGRYSHLYVLTPPEAALCS